MSASKKKTDLGNQPFICKKKLRGSYWLFFYIIEMNRENAKIN